MLGTLTAGPRRRTGQRRTALIGAVGAMALFAGAMWTLPTSVGPAAGLVGADAGASAAPQAALTTATPTMGPHGDAVSRDPEPPAGRWTLRELLPTAPSDLTGYRWPIEHARITNAFGLGRPGSFVVDGVMLHEGLDVSSFCGARITAAHDGVVLVAGRHYEAYMGWIGDLDPYRARLDARHAWRGQAIVVVVDDGNGYRSLYVHLALAAVEPGEVVRAGDRIGYEGETGEATGCHLHYGLFSPRERSTIELDPRIAARTRLPDREIARIDPLLVLPPLEDAFITWGWGAGGPS